MKSIRKVFRVTATIVPVGDKKPADPEIRAALSRALSLGAAQANADTDPVRAQRIAAGWPDFTIKSVSVARNVDEQ